MSKKTKQMKDLTKLAKEQAERNAAIQAAQEKRMEEVVIQARELLPILENANFSVDKTKNAINTLAVTLQQAVYWLMKDNTVAALKLEEKVDKNFPEHEFYLELIAKIQTLPLDLATETLQWMGEKITAIQREEDRRREFKELGMNLEKADVKPQEPAA